MLKRVAKSLLLDLIVPWIVSAALIIFFFSLFMTFGILSWVLSFGIFLIVCVLRRTHAD